jgi:hypothetical protein
LYNDPPILLIFFVYLKKFFIVVIVPAPVKYFYEIKGRFTVLCLKYPVKGSVNPYFRRLGTQHLELRIPIPVQNILLFGIDLNCVNRLEAKYRYRMSVIADNIVLTGTSYFHVA